MGPKSKGRLTIPTTKPLPDALRLPSTSPHVWKTLSRVSRASLLSLAAQWCQEDNLKTCGPYILPEDEDEDAEAAYAAAESLAEVEGLYAEELPLRKGSKREVVDRILEGDWRHGISMKQLAMVETQFVLEHQSANRWTALKIAPHALDDGEGHDSEGFANKGPHLPRLNPATFSRNLVREISPIAKAHLYIHHPDDLPVTVLRIYLHDTPYNTPSGLRTTTGPLSTRAKGLPSADHPKSIFVLFPTGTPFIYVSLSSSGTHLTDPDSKSLQKFVVEAIPKALSRPSERHRLEPTAMTARSISALLAHRGAERSNAAAGGWSHFATDSRGRNALDFADKPPTNAGKVLVVDDDAESKQDDATSTSNHDKENQSSARVGGTKRPFEHANPQTNLDARRRKRLALLAASRFGDYGLPDDGKNLHSFSVRMADSFDRRTRASLCPQKQSRTERTTMTMQQENRGSGLFVDPSTATVGQPARSRHAAGGQANDYNKDDDAEDEGESSFQPDVRITFQGSHVFAGLRALVEAGVVDGRRMPGWMTGEAGVSTGLVKHGRVEGGVQL